MKYHCIKCNSKSVNLKNKMKNTIILSVLLLFCGFSLKAQMFYLTNTTDIQECISFMETPLGTEIACRAKGTKKWAFLKVLNKPKMGGMYLVQFPDKSKQQITRNIAKGTMQVKNVAKNTVRMFASKEIYLYEKDETEYLNATYITDNNIIGFVCSITKKGITKSFNLTKEDNPNNTFELSLDGEDGNYILKNIDIRYELTVPNGTKKMYLMDKISYE